MLFEQQSRMLREVHQPRPSFKEYLTRTSRKSKTFFTTKDTKSTKENRKFFKFVLSPALHQTQCGASVVSFVDKFSCFLPALTGARCKDLTLKFLLPAIEAVLFP
jgi:hypothetical protein